MKPKIKILTTGGTIVSSGASPTQLTGYQIKDFSSEDLVRTAPGLDEMAWISVETVCRIPSSSIGLPQWVTLAEKINEAFENESCDGVVITHGTDTLEETAFFLNLILKTDRPVVVTGAMRPATALSSDGPLNLYNAVRVASDKHSKSKGILVVLNGSILCARDATKTNTISVQTFASRDFGPIGYVNGNFIRYYYESIMPHTTKTEFFLENVGWRKHLPHVEIVYAHADTDVRQFDYLKNVAPQGIVLCASGHGTVSEMFEGFLRESGYKGIVVRCSRTGSGVVIPSQKRWTELGVIPADTLSAQKARILLQLALCKYGSSNRKEIERVFSQY